MMKRASYKHGIELIALNDEPLEMKAEEVKSFISVCLLADLFGVLPSKVASDVIRFREKFEKAEVICDACNGTGSDCSRYPIEGCAKCKGSGSYKEQ